MLEDFKQHPAIRPLISGGKLLEYSAHMVPEGGLAMVPQLVNEGVMIVGDAAGFCLNLGFTVRGMDLAIASAQAAATTVIAAKERADFSASSLAQYKRELEQSCVMRDMQHFRKIPALMENPRLFSQYPRMVADIMNEMFTIDGKPNQPVRKMIMGHAKKIGLINLLKDGIKGSNRAMSQNATVNVDIKLGVNKFHVDEGHPHIILAENPDINEFHKLMKACPAGLYKQDDAGNIHFDSAGCLECGTCRVLCGNTILEQWQYPAGTFGIDFRYG